MIYKTMDSTYINEIKEIYQSENWHSYLQDDDKLIRAFQHSLYIYGAFENNHLIGFIRCVGDGEHIVVIQDLIVHPTYQKQGIGTFLLQHVLEKYQNVRMMTLFTDAYDKLDNYFYSSKGFKLIIEHNMVAYIK